MATKSCVYHVMKTLYSDKELHYWTKVVGMLVPKHFLLFKPLPLPPSHVQCCEYNEQIATHILSHYDIALEE